MNQKRQKLIIFYEGEGQKIPLYALFNHQNTHK